MSSSQSPRGVVQLLQEETLMKMFGEFSNWRIDTFIREITKKRQKGRILPFVRGLRLSAHLIYAIREVLVGTNLTANWGHLVDEKGIFCSCECDIIIHHQGHEARWNGRENQIMDFRFIKQQKALVVISCKSYLRSGYMDSEYCKLMKPFVKRIWLFAECCGPRSVNSIRKKALRLGYEKFWHLYTWSKQKTPEPNKDGWREFIEEVNKLKQYSP